MNDLVRFEANLPQTAADMKAHVQLIQEVMRDVMKENTHYGIIPGCDKPSLWKPGAEVLCATFHIAPSYRIEDLSGKGFVRYRVACIGTHQGSAIILGEGLGECSSLETKYKWRKAYKREWDATPEQFRRIHYGYNKSERSEYEVLQVRTEPADLANTMLKMAAKRGQVGMTLNVTAASDIFTQDLEDFEEGALGDATEGQGARHEPVQQPQSKSSGAKKAEPKKEDTQTNGEPKPLTEGQVGVMKKKMENATLTDADFEKKFNAKLMVGIKIDHNAIYSWIANPAAA